LNSKNALIKQERRGWFKLKSDKALENYFREIGVVALLSPDEEVKLARRIKQNDQEAVAKMVSANLRFVVSVAKSYQNHGLSLEDLINEGNLGLIKAAYRFDETRGFKFISYAVWWIRQSILQAIAEKTRMIRLPVNRVGTLTKISKVYSKLEQEYERAPSHDEIASILELDANEIANTIRQAAHVSSIDSPSAPNGNASLAEILPDPHEVKPDADLMDESLRNEVKNLLKGLTHREAKILKMYYGLDGNRPCTLEEVGVEFKLTRERIRQIKETALKKLRQSSRSRVLLPYLG
jgi:RNA polymerase primary sigma factor